MVGRTPELKGVRASTVPYPEEAAALAFFRVPRITHSLTHEPFGHARLREDVR